ncbi:PDR/VanB family oxidoreductase [Amaricoccus solimangrovi]|uniref:Oxidoreductase n=1 Tax=Amaricoccus solimangrovi TaxID=2589815 RepID=A0A501WB56_9RHOB|nr:PDR/VanB family oxidoreductase [Amaricoccus solimangrovi]TPE45735.1 oxidoreductase [Amaricoccus solimangrovi]
MTAKQWPAASKYLDARIVGRRDLTERISEFLIGGADGAALPPGDAGSHIELRFGGPAGRFLRHYSLIGPLSPEKSPEPFWRIAVQREDRFRGSAFIHATFREGTRLRVSRPIGTFRLGRNVPHALLVAGGVGITPILPMMRSLSFRNRPFHMVYAGRRREEMAYADEVEAIGGDHATILEADRSGFPDLRALLAGQPEGTVVYVCGPGPMIDALTTAAAGLGWDHGRVRYEVFNAAHRPDDHGLTVELRDGRLIEVGAGTTILDALEQAGVDTLSDCRRGECGLCLTDVVPGDAVIDHRDSFLSEAERAEGRQMCVCCSRVANASKLKLAI